MSTENKQFHTTVTQAKADGWIAPYMGGYPSNNGKVYGRKKGNHRVFRCYLINAPKEAK